MMGRKELADQYLQAIDDVAEFTEGMDFEQFSGDKKTVNAVIRSLEVLGEALERHLLVREAIRLR